MSKVYLLEHTVDDKPERMKIIGIFSSENDAKRRLNSYLANKVLKAQKMDSILMSMN